MASKVILITGGGRGIGAATAAQAVKAGYDVCFSYVADDAAAEDTRMRLAALGGRVLAVRGDVSNAADVGALFDACEAALGPVDALVNNAGITGPLCSLVDLDPGMMRRVLAVNIDGTLHCCREAVKRMTARADGQKGGAIVNISSTATAMGAPGEWVVYAASKGAVDVLTRGLAKEAAAHGIRVNAVAPGLTETTMHAAAGAPDRLERLAPFIPMGRPGKPDEIADAVMWLLSDKASYVTGQIITVSGGR